MPTTPDWAFGLFNRNPGVPSLEFSHEAWLGMAILVSLGCIKSGSSQQFRSEDAPCRADGFQADARVPVTRT